MRQSRPSGPRLLSHRDRFIFDRYIELEFCLKRIAVFTILLLFARVAIAQKAESSRFNESLRLIQGGQLAEASGLLKALVVANPKKNLYWFNLGTVEAMRGNHEYAIRVFGRVILTKSPLAPVAQLYTAKSLRALGRESEATTILNELIRQDLPSGIKAEIAKELDGGSMAEIEQQALTAYQAGDIQKAGDLLSKYSLESLSLDAILLLSVVNVERGQPDRAREVLEHALKSPSLSSERRVLATDLLKRLSRRLEAPPYWTSLDASVGSTSNAFADGRSTSGVASPLFRTSISAGYHFLRNESVSFKTGYVLNYEEPFAARELRTMSQTVQVPILYERDEVRASVSPYVQWQTWAGLSVSDKAGISVKGSMTTEKFDAGVDTDFSTMKSLSSSYSYLQGSFYSIKPYFGSWGENLYFQFFYLLGSDGTQDIVYSDSSRLPLQHTYQGPGLKLIWRPMESSALFLNATSVQKTFRSTSLPALKDRSDRELSVSLKYSQSLNPKLSIYGIGEWTNNSSTLGQADVRDKNYENLIFMAGASWDVF